MPEKLPIRLRLPVITCSPDLELRNFNNLILIAPRFARATSAGASPREARAVRAGGELTSGNPARIAPRGRAGLRAVTAVHGFRILSYAACRRSRCDQMIVRARTKWSMSASLCRGEGVRRSRPVPRERSGS
jgi:hypothetical protein